MEDCLTATTNALTSASNSGIPFDLWVVGSTNQWSCMRQVLEDDRWEDMKVLILRPGPTNDRISAASIGSAELFFMHGMLCSFASKTGTVGFVVADPRHTNLGALSLMGFYVGAKYANRSTRVIVGITGDFLDSSAEIKATQELIGNGNADCIGSLQNDLTVHRVASSLGVYSTGVAADARYFVGESVLSSILLIWQPAILPFYIQIANDSWTGNYSLHISEGTGGSLLSSFSTQAEDSWQEILEQVQIEFLNGSLNLHCTTLLTDPQWMTNATTYELSPGVFCLSQYEFYSITGIVNGAEVLVEFNSTHLPYEILYVKWSSFAAIFTTAICVLVFFLAIGTAIVVVCNLHSPVIRAASPFFLLITLTGIALSSMAPLTRISRPTKINCMLVWWMSGLGHALTWSCLIAKNWRIWRILTSARSYRSVAILNVELLAKWVVCIVIGEFIVLIVWTFYSPLIPTTGPSSTIDSDQLQIMCYPKPGKYNGGLLTWVGFNLTILLPGALVSYWTRRAKGEYQESRSLAAAIYGTFAVTILLGGVGFGLSRNYLVEYYLITFGPLFITIAVWALIFIPKLSRLASALPQESSETADFPPSALQSRQLNTPPSTAGMMFNSASSTASE